MQVSERASKVRTSNFPSLKQATNALTGGNQQDSLCLLFSWSLVHTSCLCSAYLAKPHLPQCGHIHINRNGVSDQCDLLPSGKNVKLCEYKLLACEGICVKDYILL